MNDCDLLCEGGRCRKFDRRETCAKRKSNYSWFHDDLKECSIDEVCRRASIFGNSFFRITREQLTELEQGKVLYDIDEYGTFIVLESGVEESEANYDET